MAAASTQADGRRLPSQIVNCRCNDGMEGVGSRCVSLPLQRSFVARQAVQGRGAAGQGKKRQRRCCASPLPRAHASGQVETESEVGRARGGDGRIMEVATNRQPPACLPAARGPQDGWPAPAGCRGKRGHPRPASACRAGLHPHVPHPPPPVGRYCTTVHPTAAASLRLRLCFSHSVVGAADAFSFQQPTASPRSPRWGRQS